MSTFKRTLVGAVVGLALGFGLIAQAGATTVNLTADGQWHAFDVDTFSALSGGMEWIDYVDGSELSFQVNNTQAMLLTVVDGGFAGDVFFVHDGATLLSPTSAAINNYPSSIGLDFDAALVNPLYSNRTYLLAPGSHTISGWLQTSAVSDFGAIDATVGAVMLQAVPEPTEWATLVAGLCLLSFAQRARNSRNKSRK